MKSRISSFTDTTGFMSPHSSFFAGCFSGRGGVVACDEHESANTAAQVDANTHAETRTRERTLVMRKV